MTAADWLTDGGDTKRNNWQRDETILTTANVKDMRLLWKIKLDNKPRQMHSLLEPLVIGRVNTKSGPKEMVIQAGVSDNVYAIDAKTGELLWKRHFESGYKEPPGARTQVLCPGGMTANVTVGPGQGAGNYVIYAASWDGSLHQAERGGRRAAGSGDASSCRPNGKPYALNLVKNVIYTHSAQGCGGNPNMVYTLRPRDEQGRKLGSGGRRHVGTVGSGDQQELVMYTGTGDGRWDPENGLYGNGIIGVKQDPKTKALELVDYYGPSNAEWLFKRDLDMQVTPAIFDYKGKEYMVDASKECRDLPDGHGVDRRRRSSHARVSDAADLQRDGGLRGGGDLGIAGDVGGREGDALGADAVLGAEALEVQSADRERRSEEGRDRGVQDGDGEGEGDADAGVDFARHEPGGAAADRQRHGVRVRQRREHGAGVPRGRAGLPDGAPGGACRRTRCCTRSTRGRGKSCGTAADQIASWNHFSGIALANGQVYINDYQGHVYCFGLKK